MLGSHARTLKRAFRNRMVSKHGAELAYWKERFAQDHGRFSNSHYQRIMLAMAQEPDDAFLAGKVIADFGCGPRGSLEWAKSAKLRLGIDVLVEQYVNSFGDCLRSHAMEYVQSTETQIPLDTDSVDVLYTLNAIDHVDHFETMAGEMLRILKPGGLFIGSFNLHEPRTAEEPQTLSEGIIEREILRHLELDSVRISRKPEEGNMYQAFYNDQLVYTPGEIAVLWVKGRKR